MVRILSGEKPTPDNGDCQCRQTDVAIKTSTKRR